MGECVEIAPGRATTHPFQFVSELMEECVEIPKKPKCVRKLCPHGKQKYYCKEPAVEVEASVPWAAAQSCKECGGASICDHGRQRSTCKEPAVEVPASVPWAAAQPVQGVWRCQRL